MSVGKTTPAPLVLEADCLKGILPLILVVCSRDIALKEINDREHPI